jgi:hypothetical protein
MRRPPVPHEINAPLPTAAYRKNSRYMSGEATALAETDLHAAAELFAKAESLLIEVLFSMKDDSSIPHN